jgi:hypothetical protein
MIDTSKPVKIFGTDWPTTIVDVNFNGNIGVVVDCCGVKAFHAFDKHGRQQNSHLDMRLINVRGEEIFAWTNVYAPSKRYPQGVVSSPKPSQEEADKGADRSGFCGDRAAMLKLTFENGRLLSVGQLNVFTFPGEHE